MLLVKHGRYVWTPRRCIFGFGTAAKRKNKVISYAEKRHIGFTAEQMFNVVFKVADYPHFVPWCTEVNIKSVSERVLEAELFIGFPPLNEHYTSRVTSLYPNVIRSVCTDGRLFEFLETTWRFGPSEPGSPAQSCSLDFSLDFQFKSELHAQLTHIFFAQVVRTMVSAFLKRAEHLYGPPSFDHFHVKNFRPNEISK